MRLLDLGCGIAEYHADYKNLYDEIIGIDIDSKVVKRAKRFSPSNKYYVADACKDISKIAPGKFDVVLSLDVLEHVREPRSLIENMLHYVNDTGYCYIVSPSALAFELNFRFGLLKENKKINGTAMQYLTPCVVKGIINRIGGKVIWQSNGCRCWIRPIKIKFKHY